MTTPAQAAARAENGRRYSTGPKTEAGKMVSRANALRHGLYASTLAVVPHGPLAEDPALYEAFCDGVLADLMPAGLMEEELAQSIADLLWRGARVPLYEAALLANSTEAADWEFASAYVSADELEIAAAEAMADLDADHPLAVLEWAACVVGRLVDLEMDDDWPQPRPTDQAGWVQIIDRLLVDEAMTRDDARMVMSRSAEKRRAERAKAAGMRFSRSVAEALDQKQVANLMRAEAHLTRELGRKLSFLAKVQSMRLERESM